MVLQQADKQAREIVKDFCRTKMKGEKVRNRLGNRVWPLVEKSIIGLGWLVGASLFIPGASVPLSLGMIALSYGAQRWIKGHTKYLQNLTLKNAALLGRSMRDKPVSDEVKRKAIEQFIQRESPLFTAKRYMQQNPEMLDRLSKGLSAELNKNFVSFMEANFNALASSAKKGKVSWINHFKSYKKIFQQYRQAQNTQAQAIRDVTAGISTQQLQGQIRNHLSLPTPYQKESISNSNRVPLLHLGKELLTKISQRMGSSLGEELLCGVRSRHNSDDLLLATQRGGRT